MSDLKVWNFTEAADLPEDKLYVAASRDGDAVAVPPGEMSLLVRVRNRYRRRRVLVAAMPDGSDVAIRVKGRQTLMLGPFPGPSVGFRYPKPGGLDVCAVAVPLP